jgi:hypothetical protein
MQHVPPHASTPPVETIPFSTFAGFLKSIDFSLLDDQAKIAMQWAFSAFFLEENVNAHSITYFKHLSPNANQPPYSYRRFAGDSSLPRGKYHSISNESGHDSNILLHELMTYTEHKNCGAIIPFDGEDKRTRYEIAERFHINPSSFSDRAIHVLFLDDDGNSLTPVFRSGLLKKNHKSMASVTLPYVIQNAVIDRVIDLRLPTTQKWFADQLFSGIPGLDYWYDDVVTGRLHVGESRPSTDSETLSKGHSKTAILYAPYEGWDRKYSRSSEDFFGVIPFLTFPGRGGSPITEAIGVWLRQQKVNGLVFPSARNDIGVMVRNGNLVDFIGWCFVDYRNAAPPETFIRLIIEPDSWVTSNLIERELRKGSGPTTGSWHITGGAAEVTEKFRNGQTLAAVDLLRLYHDAQDGKDGGQLLRQLGAETLKELTEDMKRLLTNGVFGDYRNKEYSRCATITEALLTVFSDEFDLFFLFGLACAKLQMHKEAIDAFQRAAVLAPGKSEPLANIGNSFLAMRKFDEAAEAYNAALKLNPSDKVASNNIKVASLLSRDVKDS